jgi:predicted component of type VI protein secretion system
MWFDAQAKLQEIAGDPPATSATSATQAPDPRPMSQKLQVSQAPEAETVCHVAKVASVATPPRREVQAPPSAPPCQSNGGRALTWTGRVVSLDAWRALTEWERHGPRGRRWCGLSRQWEGET